MDDAIFEKYVSGGEQYIYRTRNRLKDELKLNEYYRKTNEKNISAKKQYLNFYVDDKAEIQNMITDGIIIKDGEKILINQSMKKTIDAFAKYLEDIGEMKFPYKLASTFSESL